MERERGFEPPSVVDLVLTLPSPTPAEGVNPLARSPRRGHIPFATPGRGSNQTKLSGEDWSGKGDLNPRPSPWQGDALPLSYSRSFFFQAELDSSFASFGLSSKGLFGEERSKKWRFNEIR